MQKVNIDPMANPDFGEEARRIWHKIIGRPEDPVLEKMRKRRRKKKDGRRMVP